MSCPTPTRPGGGAPHAERVATERQAQVLTYVEEYRARCGFSPALREICAHFDWTSTNAAVTHLRALAAKHLATWEPGLVRTVRATESGKELVAQHRREHPIAVHPAPKGVAP